MTATFHPSHDFQRIRRATVGVATVGTSNEAMAMPNYMVRRGAVALLALAVLAAGVIGVGEAVGALADLGGRPAAASEVAPALGTSTPRVHVAAPGDTMWSIAGQYRGNVGRDRYVDALIDLNGDTSIQVGQAIGLP
ncbi:MAG TPA: LysM domain-containing protein [Ilumatobacteraceae bacterium]|nr:LysM domain-containing protein [Ilumatobacteraceae bacterium]